MLAALYKCTSLSSSLYGSAAVSTDCITEGAKLVAASKEAVNANFLSMMAFCSSPDVVHHPCPILVA